MIIINNKSYVGRQVSISGNSIVIDGVDVTPDAKVITVKVEGNIDQLSTTSAKIDVIGNVGSIDTSSGDVKVSGDVSGSIKTSSGDVECGNVQGNVRTTSGDIEYKK